MCVCVLNDAHSTESQRTGKWTKKDYGAKRYERAEKEVNWKTLVVPLVCSHKKNNEDRSKRKKCLKVIYMMIWCKKVLQLPHMRNTFSCWELAQVVKSYKEILFTLRWNQATEFSREANKHRNLRCWHTCGFTRQVRLKEKKSGTINITAIKMWLFFTCWLLSPSKTNNIRITREAIMT